MAGDNESRARRRTSAASLAQVTAGPDPVATSPPLDLVGR